MRGVGGPRARAIVVVTSLSARAAQPSEPDPRSISIALDPRRVHVSHSPSGPAPNQLSAMPAAERRWNSKQLGGDRSTTWR
jgi:hypothetical protein